MWKSTKGLELANSVPLSIGQRYRATVQVSECRGAWLPAPAAVVQSPASLPESSNRESPMPSKSLQYKIANGSSQL